MSELCFIFELLCSKQRRKRICQCSSSTKNGINPIYLQYFFSTFFSIENFQNSKCVIKNCNFIITPTQIDFQYHIFLQIYIVFFKHPPLVFRVTQSWHENEILRM